MKSWFSVRDPYKYSSLHETCLLLGAYAHLSRLAVEAGDAIQIYRFFGGLLKIDELKP